MIKHIAIITLLLCFGQAYAHEASDGKIHISLGSLTYQTQYKNDLGQVDAPIQGSGGFIVDGDLSDYGSLEIGIYYLDKIFLRRQSAVVLVEKIRRAYMTIGYRHWFTDKFSMALASYTSYSMGDPRRIHSSTGGDPGFETSAHDTSDHGADFSIAYEFYAHESDRAFIDFRYAKSLSSRGFEDGDHAAIFLGYKVRSN